MGFFDSLGSAVKSAANSQKEVLYGKIKRMDADTLCYKIQENSTSDSIKRLCIVALFDRGRQGEALDFCRELNYTPRDFDRLLEVKQMERIVLQLMKQLGDDF